MPEGAIVQAPPTAEQVSIQAALDQLEAGIDRAHSTLNEIDAPQEKEAEVEAPRAEGGREALMRCANKLSRLNGRLDRLAGLIGRL